MALTEIYFGIFGFYGSPSQRFVTPALERSSSGVKNTTTDVCFISVERQEAEPRISWRVDFIVLIIWY